MSTDKIRPMSVIANKNASLTIHKKTDAGYKHRTDTDRLAYAEREVDEEHGLESHHIHIMQDTLYDVIYRKSPLSKQFPFQALLNGVTIHEVAHIFLDALKNVPSEMDGVFHFIWNCLVDSHDEYWMSYYYPAYSPFIQLALTMVKHASPATPGTGVDADLKTLYFLTRFGTLPAQYDKDFRDFILPLIHSAIVVRDQKNVIEASWAIYYYLEQKYQGQGSNPQDQKDFQDAKENTSGAKQGISASDIKQAQQGAQALEAGNQEMLAALTGGNTPTMANSSGDEESDEENAPSTSKLAGLQAAPLMYNEADAAFTRMVIDEHGTEIVKLRAALMQLWEAPDYMPAVEGELNMAMQTELYQASFTHEEGQYYLLAENRLPSVSLVTSRDTSGSTDDVQVEYATAAVVVVASAGDIDGIEVSAIDFNYGAFEQLAFGQPVEQLALAPKAEGGTSLDDALDLIDKMRFNEAIRIHLVITDGYIDSWERTKGRLKRLELERGLQTFIVNIVESYGNGNNGYAEDWPGSFVSTIADLPEKVMDKIIKTIQASRGYAYASN